MTSKPTCTCRRSDRGLTCRCTCEKCGGTSLSWKHWGSYLDRDLVCDDCRHVQDVWDC